MSNDPLTISLDRIAELLRGLGLDPVHLPDIKGIHITPGQVKVVRHRRDADGRQTVVVGEGEPGVATETITIGIEG